MAGQQAAVHQGGLDGGVGCGHLDAVGDGAHRVAHIQSQVPQEIEQLLGKGLHPFRRQAAIVQEHDVHIGVGVQLASTVAAHCHQGQMALVRTIDHR